MRQIDEEMIRRIAALIGPASAAAAALRDAESRRERGEIVSFFRDKHRIIVCGPTPASKTEGGSEV